MKHIKKSPLIIALLLAVASLCMGQETTDANLFVSPESLPIEELRDLFAQHGNIGDFEAFLSDNADCNQGVEPLREFVLHMNADPSFKADRLKKVNQGLPYTDFLFFMDKDKRLTRYWRNLRGDSAEYAIGWFTSDLIYVFQFRRIKDEWYLTGFLEHNNRY